MLGGGKKKDIDSHNSGILVGGGYAHAIYFNDYYSSYKDIETKVKELCEKFSNNQGSGFINAYFGENRVLGPDYSQTGDSSSYSTIGAKKPRSLKEFEYYGNNNKFEKAAKDTYDESELSTFDKNNLNVDSYKVAQNNRSCFSSTAKSFG